MAGGLRAGLRRSAGHAYRRVMARPGRRVLDRAVAAGLPARLEAPIRFLFDAVPPPRAAEAAARIERRRQDITADRRRFRFVPIGTPLGEARWPGEESAAATGPAVTPAWLARVASVPARWGTFLHLCADGEPGGPVLELGACVGIGSAYLATARGCRGLVTLEGSPVVAPIARATLDALAPGAVVVEGAFHETLGRVLAGRDGDERFDLVYLDGHHDEAATLDYVRRVRAALRPGGLIVLDDIYLYAEMWRAWRRLSETPGFSAAVNVGRFGLLVCADAPRAPTEIDFSRYTGWWRVGGARRDTPLPADMA